jgi:hypothetical protein
LEAQRKMEKNQEITLRQMLEKARTYREQWKADLEKCTNSEEKAEFEVKLVKEEKTIASLTEKLRGLSGSTSSNDLVNLLSRVFMFSPIPFFPGTLSVCVVSFIYFPVWKLPATLACT